MKLVPNFKQDWQRTLWVCALLAAVVVGFYYLSPTNRLTVSYAAEVVDNKLVINHHNEVVYIKEENVSDELQKGIFFLDKTAFQIQKTDQPSYVEYHCRGWFVSFKSADELAGYADKVVLFRNPADELVYEAIPRS